MFTKLECKEDIEEELLTNSMRKDKGDGIREGMAIEKLHRWKIRIRNKYNVCTCFAPLRWNMNESNETKNLNMTVEEKKKRRKEERKN